jgi:hypothetical protein
MAISFLTVLTHSKNNFMKNQIKIMRVLVQFIFLAAFLIFAGSCKKNSTEVVAAPGHVSFHLHTDIDTAEVDTSQIYKDHNGRKIQIKLAQFYISGVALIRADGSQFALPGTIAMKSIPTEEYSLGDVPPGNYVSVTFNVGLSPSQNQTNPATEPAGNYLAAQTPPMWFGSTTKGYMFMNIQGKVDTSALNNGPVNVPISYEIGTNALLQTVRMPNQTFAIVSGQNSFVHIICDYGKLLSVVNFKTSPTADPFTNLPVATQIANNIPNMFHYE